MTASGREQAGCVWVVRSVPVQGFGLADPSDERRLSGEKRK